MKRNWKIIRAIMCEEDTSRWPAPEVKEHRMLCADAGYVDPKDEKLGPSRRTPKGEEVATLMAVESDLDEVLQQLSEKGVGSVSDFVMGLLARKVASRQNKEPSGR
jgi:hypothetical protein